MSTAIAPSPQRHGQTAVAPRTFASVDDLLKDAAIQRQISRALPKGMDADRMMRIAISAVSKNPVLKECTPMSVGLSIIKAAEMGLQVDGWEAHLVPYKNKGRMECQFIADYKGLCKLAYQSELVIEIHAEVVCENDEFDYEKGTETFLRWKPARGDRGDMLGAWAGAKMKGGGFPFIVMWRSEIMQHKAKSQGAKSDFSPWNTPEGEPWMWKKTALRALCKMLPRSSQLLELLKADEADELGGNVVDGVLVQAEPEEPISAPSKASQLAGRLPAPSKSEQTDAEPSKEPDPNDRLKEEWWAAIAEADAARLDDLLTTLDQSDQIPADVQDWIRARIAERRKAIKPNGQPATGTDSATERAGYLTAIANVWDKATADELRKQIAANAALADQDKKACMDALAARVAKIGGKGEKKGGE